MAQKTGRPEFSPPPKEVIRLALTRRRSTKKEQWFVAAPITRGPQHCIIKQTDNAGRVVFRDAAIVLPSTVPSYRPCKNPVVAAALSVAEYQHRKLVAAYRKNSSFMSSNAGKKSKKAKWQKKLMRYVSIKKVKERMNTLRQICVQFFGPNVKRAGGESVIVKYLTSSGQSLTRKPL